MELQLINQDLSESRLYRTTRNMKDLSGRDITELLYLETLAVFLLYRAGEKGKYYANKTSQFGNYRSFKTNSTDLYMLAHVVSNPESLSLMTDDVNILKKARFNDMAHYRFMKEISKGNVNNVAGYLYRLESQLKINNSKLKEFRRNVVSWNSLSSGNKRMLASKMSIELRRLARGSELIQPLQQFSKPASFARRATGAVAGAVAGRHIGGKLSKQDTERGKKIGTGLGAIAGYWAAGRK